MSDDTQRPWLKWYDTKRWIRRARMQKRLHSLCAMCLEKGLVVACEVADHIEPHRGDYQKFFFGALQSLCWPCHSKEKQQIERRGYTTNIGLDGWPTDERHPSSIASRGDRNAQR